MEKVYKLNDPKTYKLQDMKDAVDKARHYFSTYKIISEQIMELLQRNDRFFEDNNKKGQSLFEYLKQKKDLGSYIKNIYFGRCECRSTQSFRRSMVECILSICSGESMITSDSTTIFFDELFDLMTNEDEKNSIK